MVNTWRNVVVKPNSDSVDIDKKQIENDFYSDIDKVRLFYNKKTTKKSMSSLSTEDESFLKEYNFFIDHADFRKHAIYFARCPSFNACDSCQDYYDSTDLPVNFEEKMGLPNKKNNNALFFEPEEDPSNPGHFKTFLQQRKEFIEDKLQKIKPDSNITDGPVEQCSLGCNLTFRSKAGAEKHYMLQHRKGMSNDTQTSNKQKRCLFQGCNLVFPSIHYLRKHQTEMSHQNTKNRGRRPRQTVPDFVGESISDDEGDFHGFETVSSEVQDRRAKVSSLLDFNYEEDEDEEKEQENQLRTSTRVSKKSYKAFLESSDEE